MAAVPPSYNKLHLDSVLFTKPEKRSSRILTFAYRKVNGQAKHVIFQTSRSVLTNVDLEKGKLTMKADDDFRRFLNKMTNHLVGLISSHGGFFFGGKTYPLDKIQSSFLSPVNETGDVTLRLRSNGMIISDQFGKKIPIATLAQFSESEAILLLQFDGLSFTRTNIEPIFTVISMRVYTVAHPDEYTINPDEEDDTMTYRPVELSRSIITEQPKPVEREPEPEPEPEESSLMKAKEQEPVQERDDIAVSPNQNKKLELPVVYMDQSSVVSKATESQGGDSEVDINSDNHKVVLADE